MEAGADITSQCKTTENITHLSKRTQKFLLPNGVSFTEANLPTTSQLEEVSILCSGCGSKLMFNRSAKQSQAALLAQLATVNFDSVSPNFGHCAFRSHKDAIVDLGILIPNHFVAIDSNISCPCCTMKRKREAGQDETADVINVACPAAGDSDNISSCSSNKGNNNNEQRGSSPGYDTDSEDRSDYGSLDTVLPSNEYRQSVSTDDSGLDRSNRALQRVVSPDMCYASATEHDYQKLGIKLQSTDKPVYSTSLSLPAHFADHPNANGKQFLQRPHSAEQISPELDTTVTSNKKSNIVEEVSEKNLFDSFEREFEKALELADAELKKSVITNTNKHDFGRQQRVENVITKESNDTPWTGMKHRLDDPKNTLSLDELTAMLEDLSQSISDMFTSHFKINDGDSTFNFHELRTDDKAEKGCNNKDDVTVDIGLITEEDSGNTKVVSVSQKKVRFVPDSPPEGKRSDSGQIVQVNVNDKMMHDTTVQSQLAQTVKNALDSSTKRRVLKEEAQSQSDKPASDNVNGGVSDVDGDNVKEEIIVIQEATVVLSWPKKKLTNGAASTLPPSTKTAAAMTTNEKPVREMLVKRHTKISDLPAAAHSDFTNSFTSVSSSI